MSAFRLPITCAHCGADVRLLTSGSVAGTAMNAMVRCDACPAEFLVAVQMRQVAVPSAIRRQDARSDRELVDA